MLSRVLAGSRSLLRYEFSWCTWQQIPKPHNVYIPKERKKLFKNPQLRPFSPFLFDFNDTLTLPGMDESDMFNMYSQFIERKETPLSSQFVALMLYNFSKNGLLNRVTWQKLQPYISRNRGQYSMRSIFGCLYSCIRYGKAEYVKFFTEELTGQKLGFTDLQAVEIAEAFNLSKYPFTTEEKHTFWQTFFLDAWMTTIRKGIRVHKYKDVLRIFDAFDKFEYYKNEEMWNGIIEWMAGRKGWKRAQIIERLYPLTGTFDKAKQVFDAYYAEMSTSDEVQWRYNLQELRFYTSEEMIAKSQENINMRPNDRTIIRRQDQKQRNEEYHRWLQDGARQKEAELIKDKAQSLAYAIKNRYESMRKDNTDFSKLSLEQFEDLFGQYNPDMMYRPPGVEMEGAQQVQEEGEGEAAEEAEEEQGSES